MFSVKSETSINNEYYQKEIRQCPRYCQLIVMSLLPGEQVPYTSNYNICKLLHIMAGTGVLYVMKDEKSKSRKHLMPGMCVMVYPNVAYNIINNGEKPLKMLVNNTPPVQEFQNIKRPEKTGFNFKQGMSNRQQQIDVSTKNKLAASKKSKSSGERNQRSLNNMHIHDNKGSAPASGPSGRGNFRISASNPRQSVSETAKKRQVSVPAKKRQSASAPAKKRQSNGPSKTRKNESSDEFDSEDDSSDSSEN
jgi:mannose-6-phosphate isomerase-like protein (cupin superfamily)